MVKEYKDKKDNEYCLKRNIVLFYGGVCVYDSDVRNHQEERYGHGNLFRLSSEGGLNVLNGMARGNTTRTSRT